jgi:hypothetical protein
VIAADSDLDALFKRLHLANARRVWRGLIDRAEREHWAYRDFLTLLATEEIAHRQQTRLARLTRRAHFPFLKTIDDFNFTYQSSLRLQMLGSALSPDFITEGRSVILAGKPGRGKTHLAIAIAYRAIQNGFDAFFTTAAALIDDLCQADHHHTIGAEQDTDRMPGRNDLDLRDDADRYPVHGNQAEQLDLQIHRARGGRFDGEWFGQAGVSDSVAGRLTVQLDDPAGVQPD